MLINTQPPTVLNSLNVNITELNVISHYDEKIALEMLYLIRRISFLKSMTQATTAEQAENFNDVFFIKEFIRKLLAVYDIKNIDI
jgi:hypothetical protein